jgi:hypothetical protein
MARMAALAVTVAEMEALLVRVVAELVTAMAVGMQMVGTAMMWASKVAQAMAMVIMEVTVTV